MAKQICAWYPAHHGTLEDDDGRTVENTHPAIKAAVAFALPLIDAYAAGTIADAAELKLKNQEKLKADGVGPRKVLRRPAAAEAEEGDTK